MKTTNPFAKPSVADGPKSPRPSRLRLENLEDRRLLSVTDLAAFAASSDADELVLYATAANVSDAVIDVSSALASSDANAFTAAGLASADNQLESFAGLDVMGAPAPENCGMYVNQLADAVDSTQIGVPVAEVVMYGFTNPTIAIDQVGFTIDQENRLILYDGAVPDSYNVIVVVSEEGVVKYDTFAIVVSKGKLSTPVVSDAVEKTNAITFTWDPVSQATRYAVSINGAELGVTHLTSYTVSGLTSNTEYRFGVVAKSDSAYDSDPAVYYASTLPFVEQIPDVVLYNTDANVPVANLITTDFVNPAISVNSEAFAVQGNQVVFVGGASGTYNLTVTAVESGVTHTGKFSVVVNKSKLATPGNLTASNATEHTIALSWDAVPLADGYKISYDGVTKSADTNSSVVTGLASDTEYTFELWAYAADMISSDRVVCVASTQPYRTLTVTLIENVDVYNTDTNAVVGYVETTGFKAAPTFTVSDAAFTVVGNELVFIGGSSGVHGVTVSATEDGVTRSDTIQVTVKIGQLPPPANFVTTAVTNNSISIAWDPVPNANKYLVHIGAATGMSDSRQVFTNSCAWTGLWSDTEHTFSVSAYGDDRYASDIATYTVSTRPDPALNVTPRNLNFDNTDVNVLVADVETVGLDAPTITVDNAAFDVVNNQVVFVAGPSGNYTLTITASEGDVTLTETLDVVVNKGTLQTPDNLRLTELTHDSFTIAWDAVPKASHYVVCVYDYAVCLGTREVSATSSSWTDLASNAEYTFWIYAVGDDMNDSPQTYYNLVTTNPTLTVTRRSGEVYNTDVDVVVADIATTVFVDPEITVNNDAFAVVNNELVFLGGGQPEIYELTVTATEGTLTRSQTIQVVVEMGQLAPPANLRATAITTDSITLAWDEVRFANEYSVIISAVGYFDYKYVYTNAYTATGLTSNTEYTINVYANGNGVAGSPAATCAVSTLVEKTLTVTPIAVTVYNTDANVAVADVATTGFVAPAITVDKPEFDFVNNQVVFVGGASGTYTVTVTASEDGVVRTQTFDVVVNKTKLATPANFRTTAVTNSSVTFAWDLVPYADRYTLVFYGGTYDTTATSPFTWTGLASDTEYLFVIRAFGNDMVSSDAAALTVRTAPDASGAWATLSTDSPVFGDTIVVSIAPDSTATYAWYSVDADDVETPLGAATSEYQIADVDLIGKRLKAVVTYASGEFTGQVVSVTTANPVVQEALGVTISQVVPHVGAELTAHLTIPGATVAYQWYRVGDDGEEAIADATLSSYTVTAEDVGFYLKVVATGTGDYTGSASAMTAVLAVAENPLTLSTLDPVLGGRIRGYLNPADSFATYQWQVYDEALGKWDHIEGATYSYFTPSYGLVGKYLRLRATYTRTENAGLSVSVATNRVERPLVSITISGDENLQTGSELTTALVYKYATADYQWYRGAAADGDAWTAIEGATGKTYTASDADKGYYLKVVATGTGVFSGVVEDVTAESVFVERLSFVTGAYPQLGERIQVALNPAGPATYAWSVVDGEGNATAIPGYTASYWTPSYDHVGYTVRVTATYLSGDFAGQSYTLDTADVVTRDVSKMHITLYPDSGRLVGERVGAYVVPTYATVTYQWYRVDAEDVETLIDGATNKRYTTTSADEGFRMKVVATGVHPYVNSNSAITSYTIGAAFSDAELDEDVFDLLALSLLD